MVTIEFKTFDAFKTYILSVKFNPDRFKPDRYHVVDNNGTSIDEVAFIGLAGRILAKYDAAVNEISVNDPWLQAIPDTDLEASIAVKSIE